MKHNSKKVFIILILVATINGMVGPLSILVQEYLVNTMESITDQAMPVTIIFLPIFCLFLLYMVPNIRFISDHLKIIWNAELEIKNILRLQGKMKKLPYILLENHEIYDKIAYLKENNQYELRYSLVLQIMQLLINMTLYIYVLARYSWFLPILCLLLVPVITFYSMKFSKEYYNKLFSMTFDQRLALDKLDILKNRDYAKELRVFGSKDFVMQDYAKCITTFNNEYLKSLVKHSTLSKLIAASKYIPILLCMLSVLLLYSGEHMTLAAFVAVSSHLINMNFLEFYQGLVSNYSKYRLVCKTNRELGLLCEDGGDAALDKLGSGTQAEIIFDHVSFRYPNAESYILNDVSFRIRGNKKIALVGENGSGKSTLIKLMLGLYQPEKGHILLNGIHIQTLSRQTLARFFGCTFQDYAKYSLSLKENIGLGAEKEEWEAVAKTYEIDEIAARCADSYDTILGKAYGDSVDLSGGEWQKVAIARTLAGNKDVYIFDEPTAALDPIAEVNTFRRIMEQSCEHMTFFVTHRLGISNRMDLIMVLREGRIDEIGSFEKLMEQKGSFYQLYDAQRQMYTGKEST